MAWYAKFDGSEGGSTNTTRDPDRIVFNETEARGDGIGGTLIADDILFADTPASAEGGDDGRGGGSGDLSDLLFDIVDNATEGRAGSGGGVQDDLGDILYDIVDSATETRQRDGDADMIVFRSDAPEPSDAEDQIESFILGRPEDAGAANLGSDGITDIPDCIIWNIDGADVSRSGDDDLHDRQAAGGHDELVIFGGKGEVMYAVAEMVPDYSEFDFTM